MNQPTLYHLPQLSCVRVNGTDAVTIIHNVTTNEVKTLNPGQGCETFITDVRGKTLGHGYWFRRDDAYDFVGAAGQSQVLHDHLDKYTIREDAVPEILDAKREWYVIPPAVVADPESPLVRGMASDPDQSSTTPASAESTGVRQVEINGHLLDLYQTEILGQGTWLIAVPVDQVDAWTQSLNELGIQIEPENSFHQVRVMAGFPWYGIDLDEKNLPQELDRDAKAISFTKGCYLGQETVARLDAMGQVQRKLVRWSLSGSLPQPGAVLKDGDKPVGRLTSIATFKNGDVKVNTSDHNDRSSEGNARTTDAIALGYARRTHFDVDSRATGNVTEDATDPGGQTGTFVGIVIE